MYALDQRNASAKSAAKACEPWPSERTHLIHQHDLLFHEGDEATWLYEVVSGVLCSYRYLADGRRQVLSFSYPGDIIGLGHGDAYHCYCEALGEVRVRRASRVSLRQETELNPSLGARLLNLATTQVSALQDLSLWLGRKSAQEKIASFLISLVERTDAESDIGATVIELPMSRIDISDFLGATVETVSRNFSQLKKLGVIALPHATTVVILDIARLRDIADGETNNFDTSFHARQKAA